MPLREVRGWSKMAAHTISKISTVKTVSLITVINTALTQQEEVGPGCVLLCPRIDPLRFLAGCRRRRLNQGLVVALGFSCC